IVAAATATPNGSFSRRGLSNEICGFFFKPNAKNPLTNVHILRSVSITRPTRYTWTMAIIPDAKILPTRTKRNNFQPRNAPTAPINFQSPAPRALSPTNGSKIISARPLPPRANNNPCQPFSTTCNVTPERKPGTVSQLGMRRERQSSKAAEIVSANVRIQMICAAGMKSYSSPNCIESIALAGEPSHKKLRRGQVACGLIENTVNCTGQCAQRRDCRQGEKY